jgi:hypothetical protein
MALTDFQTLVSDLVRDDAGKISNAQRDIAITGAVIRYSKDRPRPRIEDVAASGGNLLGLPTGWENDFSVLQGLEYPIGKVPPSMINSQAYSLYSAPAGLSIMVGYSIPVSAAVRVTYTIAHQVDIAVDTVPAGDREAVCCLAAANLCDQLASLYSGDSDSTILADNVNHQSKASEFAKRAKDLRKRYFDELGIDTKKNMAAGAVVQLTNTDSQGRPRLTHRRGIL